METGRPEDRKGEGKSLKRRLLLGLLVMAVASPIGIVLPRLFRSTGAFGEWGPEHFEKAVGYVPEGLKDGAGLWHAPAAGYTFSQGAPFGWQLFFYAVSAVLGLFLVLLAAAAVYRMGRKR